MNKNQFLKFGVSTIGLTITGATFFLKAEEPNILLVTVDDMNYNSVGTFGCTLKNTTPTIDKLALEGVRFEQAHIVCPNSMPSRNCLLSGMYPHTNGVEGFYDIQNNYPTLSDLLKNAGYFTGIRGKVNHSTPHTPYNWDIVLDETEGGKKHAKDPNSYYESAMTGFSASIKAKKPFFMVINISDPHKPFYGMNGNCELKNDPYVPSLVFTPEQVPTHAFLPNHPDVKLELAHYYSSVRRADDCVKAILTALNESKLDKNTIIFFLSDHGMPLPFAKTSVYNNGSRTPLIIKWEGKIKPNSVVKDQMVSAVDFTPTVLDIVGVKAHERIQGRSFFPLLLGKSQNNRNFVIMEYNESSSGQRHPMRSIRTKKYGYIFNPWANGTRKFSSATTQTITYRTIESIAITDSMAAERLKFFDYRVLEEFYDYEKDPDALQNLINNPAYANEINKHRAILEKWMIDTKDHCLEPFQKRYEAAFVNNYVEQKQQESKIRRQSKPKKNKENELD